MRLIRRMVLIALQGDLFPMFGYYFFGLNIPGRAAMKHRGNLPAKSDDHKSPDQGKINQVWNDGIKSSDEKHGLAESVLTANVTKNWFLYYRNMISALSG